ncbi:MAG: Flp family type IVb pilin [Solirubrobacteraceae bacterium]
MSSIRHLMLRLAVEGGQTLAEYGIVVAVIAIVVVVSALLFGSSVSELFKSSAHGL